MTSAVQTLPAGGTQTKPLWAAVTVLGVAVLALGASLIYIQNRPLDGHAALATLDAASLAALAEPPTPVATPLPVTAVASDEVIVTKPAAKPAPDKVRPVAPRAQAMAPPAAEPAPAPVVITESGPVPSQVIVTPPQRVVCASCGRVEAVTPVERKGAAQGVGAVAGGVLGAVVGNQVGKGSGRAIATIIGAVGGGVAGNTIEKNVSKETVYQVLVRMDDGSLRSVEQSTIAAIGAAVVVDGNTLRLQQAGATDGASAPRPVIPQAKVYSTERL